MPISTVSVSVKAALFFPALPRYPLRTSPLPLVANPRLVMPIPWSGLFACRAAEEFPEVAVNEATCPTTGQRGSGQGPQQASSQSPKPRPLKWPPPLVSTVPRPREPALVKGVGRGGGAGSMRHQGVKRPQTAGSVGSETAASQEKSLPAEALRRRMVPKFGKLAESAANKAPKGNLVGGQDIRAMREPSVPNDQAVTRPKAPASPRVLPPPQAPATETKAQKRTPAPAPQPQPKEQARKEAAAPTEQGGWLALGPTTPHSPGKVSSRALEELRGNRDGKGPEKMHRVPDGPTTVGALAAIGSPGLPGQGKGSCGRSTEAPKAAGGSPAVNQASCAPKPHAEAGPKASTGRKEGEAGAWKGPARRTPPPLPRKGQARPKVATKATRGTNEDRRRLTMDSASSYSAPEGNKSEGKEKPARPEEQPKASGVDNLPARGESAPRGPGKLSHSAPKARVGNVRKAKAVPLLPPPPGEKQVITLAPAPKPPKAPVGDEKAGGAESKTPGWSPGFGPLLEDLIAANAEGTRSLAEQGKFLARYRQLVQC